MERVVVITGPTASGKTGVAIELSQNINGEIISADSMQIYKKFDIGTAKPTKEERQAVPHHMIDVAEPDENYNVARYKEEAYDVISMVLSKGKVPVVTGGTGLYIDALVMNMDFSITDGGKKSGMDYEEILSGKGAEFLYELLRKRDMGACVGLHKNNTRRVIRYLEILESFPGTLKDYRENTLKKKVPFDFKIFILEPDRKFLYSRIERRIDNMMNNGLISEVSMLLKSGIGEHNISMQGIGYKETLLYLRGLAKYDEFVNILKRNTRRYAKRQITWFKRYEDAVHIKINDGFNIKSTADYIKCKL